MSGHEAKTKVFGIGLSRTATTSLAQALQMLGYESVHFPWLLRFGSGRLHPDFEPVHHYDALTDTPVARFYRELDEAFPESKFILTVRDRQSWLRSCEKYFYPGRLNRGSSALGFLPFDAVERLHLDLYGALEFERDRFSAAYDRHIAGVKSHFRGREHKVLKLDICGGDGWGSLCPFLDKPVPKVGFPKLHPGVG